jgi:hypothetical protein
MDKEYYNKSGCADPTAYEAIRNLQRADAQREAKRLITELKALAVQNGFTVINRIRLKDKKSGFIFR